MPVVAESVDHSELAALSLDESVEGEAYRNGNGHHKKEVDEDAEDVDEEKRSGKSKKKKKKKSKSKSILEKPLSTQKLVDQHFPWTAVNKQTVGRCAIASRDIKAGELVVAEHCFAFIPRSQDRDVVCHSCCFDISPPAQAFECSGCAYAKYCKNCKKGAMEEHKLVCQVSNPISAIAKIADCDEDLLRFVFALVLKKHARKKALAQVSKGDHLDGDFKDGTIKDGIIYPSYEDTISLKTHSERASTVWKDSVRRGCQLLLEEAEKMGAQSADKLDMTTEELENLAALVNTNSHGMGAHGTGFHNADVAVGIFPFVSMLSHSCRPNCCFSSEGRIMYVRATQDISKDTELCVSYINLYEPRNVRKTQLAVSKYFLCCCERCSEPFALSVDRYLEGCMCTVRGCGGVMVKTSSMYEQDKAEAPGDSVVLHNSSTWKCDQCSRVLDPKSNAYPMQSTSNSLSEQPWQLVTTAEEKLAAAMAVYKERRFKDARLMLEEYIRAFTGKLHPLNVLLFDALTPLMNCCRATGDAAEGSRLCRSILNSLEKVLPGVSLEQANFYFCLGEMYQQRSESAATNVMVKHYKKLAQETFQQVRKIREICLGKPSLPS